MPIDLPKKLPLGFIKISDERLACECREVETWRLKDIKGVSRVVDGKDCVCGIKNEEKEFVGSVNVKRLDIVVFKGPHNDRKSHHR